MRRLCGVLGIGAPLLATLVVLIGGLVTPGYDPVRRTISRLAEPGLPAAVAVGFAIFVVGLALLGLAVALGARAVGGRVLVGIAGASLLVAAAVPLDPASDRPSTIHRSPPRSPCWRSSRCFSSWHPRYAGAKDGAAMDRCPSVWA
jgi:hypothetical protein